MDTVYLKTILLQVIRRLTGRTISRHRNQFCDIRRILSSERIRNIIDAGAYHGEISKKFASIFKQANIYAFEPYKESFTVLCDEVKRYKNIYPLNYALSSSPGKKNLYITKSPIYSSLLPARLTGQRLYNGCVSVKAAEVNAITIDDWAKDSNISFIDIIKLDIQGYELEALKGASRMLETVKLIYTEVEFNELYKNNCLFYQIEAFLKPYDFCLYQLYDLMTAKNGQLICADATFVKRGFIPPLQ